MRFSVQNESDGKHWLPVHGRAWLWYGKHRRCIALEWVHSWRPRLRDDSWKRPRWFRRTIRRAHIEMDKGHQVPVPGKGENSWDIDDDAIYGMTCPARTPDEAAAAMQESALRSRRRYGGDNWCPVPTVPIPRAGAAGGER